MATGWVDRFAPVGAIWVCSACGNTSQDLFGGPTASATWGDSCMMNAVLRNLAPDEQVQTAKPPMAIEAETER